MSSRLKILFLSNQKNEIDKLLSNFDQVEYHVKNEVQNFHEYDFIFCDISSPSQIASELLQVANKVILLSMDFSESIYNEYLLNGFNDYLVWNEFSINYLKKKFHNKISKTKKIEYDCLEQIFNILSNFNQSLILIDENGNIIFCSKSFLNQIEYSSSEIESLGFLDINISVKGLDELKNIVSNIENKFVYESRYKTKSGKQILFKEQFSKITINNVSYFLIDLFEITELALLKEKYDIIKEKYEKIFFNKHSAMLIVHPETGKIIDVNEAAEKFYGISRETFITNTYVFDFNYDKTISSLKDFKIAAVKGSNSFFARHITKDGLIREVQVSAGKINLRGKDLIFTVINDITDKINYAKEVEIFKAAFNQSPLSIIITNNEGNIIYVNEAFTKITGYEEKEVINKSPKLLSPDVYDKNLYLEITKTIYSGQNWSSEMLIKRKNDELQWQSISIASIKDEFGEIKNFLIISEDITEKKELMRQLETSKQESETANKVKTEFLIQLSHELRNPLHVLINSIDFMLMDSSQNLDQDSRIVYDSALIASERIKKVVNLLSEMAVLNSNNFIVKKENVFVYKDIILPIYKEHLKFCQTKNNNFEIEKSFDELRIQTDKHCLYQIILNIVDNAIKFTKDGIIKLQAIKRNNHLEFIITDNGIGISEEFLPKVFDDFSQEQKGFNRAFDGNGMGLALVKKFSNLIDAEVSIESEKNIGTKVSVLLKNIL